MMDNFDEVEQLIIKALDEVIEKFKAKEFVGNKNWTNEIKKSLLKVGKNKEFGVCPDENGGQWLYDLIWYKNNNRKLEILELIVECEWKMNLGAIKYDFEKLLISNSNYKLMICQSNNKKIDELINTIKTSVDKYKLLPVGNTILLSILNNDTTEFKTLKITKE